jgi:hypothetical protein
MSNEAKRSDAGFVVDAGGQEHSHRQWTNTIADDQYQRSIDSRLRQATRVRRDGGELDKCKTTGHIDSMARPNVRERISAGLSTLRRKGTKTVRPCSFL